MYRVLLLLAPSIALAGKPIPDPKQLDALLAHDELVKRFGTVGYPLADEIDRGDKCTKEITTVDVGFGPYVQLIDDTKFGITLGATSTAVSDPYRLGASMVVSPALEMFDEPVVAPIAATLDAHTNSDGSSSLAVKVTVLGYTVDSVSVTAASAQSHAWALGYQVTEPANLHAFMPQGTSCNCIIGFDGDGTSHHYVGGSVSAVASPSGHQVRALLAATSWSDLHVEPYVHPWGYRPAFDARIDLLHFLFAGRMQVLPRPDGTWIVDGASYVSVSDTMGSAPYKLAEPKLGNPVLFELTPAKHERDVEYACTLEPKLTPKG